MSSLLSGTSGGANVEEPPEKNPEKYSSNIAKRGQGLHVLVEAFFKENITRARDRNVRWVKTMKESGLPDGPC